MNDRSHKISESPRHIGKPLAGTTALTPLRRARTRILAALTTTVLLASGITVASGITLATAPTATAVTRGMIETCGSVLGLVT